MPLKRLPTRSRPLEPETRSLSRIQRAAATRRSKPSEGSSFEAFSQTARCGWRAQFECNRMVLASVNIANHAPSLRACAWPSVLRLSSRLLAKRPSCTFRNGSSLTVSFRCKPFGSKTKQSAPPSFEEVIWHSEIIRRFGGVAQLRC